MDGSSQPELWPRWHNNTTQHLRTTIPALFDSRSTYNKLADRSSKLRSYVRLVRRPDFPKSVTLCLHPSQRVSLRIRVAPSLRDVWLDGR